MVHGQVVRNESAVEARTGDEGVPSLADEFTPAGESRVGEANQNLFYEFDSEFPRTGTAFADRKIGF
ncbi:hypothetical protein LINGRAHAP2_LOCUS5606 [Linum grandiflorum]